ncbi:protein lin-37 homolog [Hyposmocoma kahamanoa]|uniref:protein lin-37 homolog n=1 Tax=Hyposmocoma kahamanoa TaxID=1477025 RepID=UPI000E6D8976|nr:protein lin-37 homolog [Hyposmocoma kahamanoa]
MPKRRRLLTPMKKKHKPSNSIDRDYCVEESTPRGRLKGALLYALEPATEESDASLDKTPIKRESFKSQEYKKERRYSSEDDKPQRRRSPLRQSYVLKLFDRSVDLSQFEENSPLYPICRAWMANQPKIDYREFGKSKYEDPPKLEDSVELPGPDGPPVSRIPDLLPEQEKRSKDNINLNYREAPPPTREQLLQSHMARWKPVRLAWLEQASKVEARYEATQQVLNKINVK